MDFEEVVGILVLGMKFGCLTAFILLMLYTFGLGTLVSFGQAEAADSMPLREIVLIGFGAGSVGCFVGWLRLRLDG